MTPQQARALRELAADFGHGDAALIQKVEADIRKPPRTTEEVCYYVSGGENEFENCFRHLVALLKPHTTSAEDKYTHEIFDQWIGDDCVLKTAPTALAQAFPEFFAPESLAQDEAVDSSRSAEIATARIRERFAAGMLALEKAFEEAGLPLLSLDTAGGDTMVFANVEKSVADKWRGIVLGHTYQGKELAIREPMWLTFWHHIEYAFGLRLGDPPAFVASRR